MDTTQVVIKASCSSHCRLTSQNALVGAKVRSAKSDFKQMQDVKVGGRWQEELFAGTDILERALMSSAGGASAEGDHQF